MCFHVCRVQKLQVVVNVCPSCGPSTRREVTYTSSCACETHSCPSARSPPSSASRCGRQHGAHQSGTSHWDHRLGPVTHWWLNCKSARKKHLAHLPLRLQGGSALLRQLALASLTQQTKSRPRGQGHGFTGLPIIPKQLASQNSGRPSHSVSRLAVPCRAGARPAGGWMCLNQHPTYGAVSALANMHGTDVKEQKWEWHRSLLPTSRTLASCSKQQQKSV